MLLSSSHPAQILETCPAKNQPLLGRLLATTTDLRFRAVSIGQDVYLRDLQGPKHLEQSHVFLAFAAALRDGVLTDGQPLTGSTVERTIQVCGQVLAERGFDDPCRQDQSQPRLDPALARYLQRCKQKDPAPV